MHTDHIFYPVRVMELRKREMVPPSELQNMQLGDIIFVVLERIYDFGQEFLGIKKQETFTIS